MPTNQTYDPYVMVAAGATKTFVSTTETQVYEITCAAPITLLADMIFSYSGTPDRACEFKFQYGGGVTSNTAGGITVSFFGTDLTDAQALLALIIVAYWNGSTWVINIGRSDAANVANPIVNDGLGIIVTPSGSNPITYDVASYLPALNNIYISKSGVDVDALPNRPDRPYLTIAAARAAAVALSPTSIARVRITVLNGTYTNEQIVLFSYIDWDLGSSLIYTTTNTIAITDNNVTVTDCTIYGRANLLHTTSSGAASALKSIYLQNASSNVVAYLNNITINSSGTPISAYAVHSIGTLSLYCNDIYVAGLAANSGGIFAETSGIITANVHNIYVSSTTIVNTTASVGATAKLYLTANDLTADLSSNSYTASCQTGALFYLNCNNIYNLAGTVSAGDVSCICTRDGVSRMYVRCNNIICTPATSIIATCINFGKTSFAQTSGAILSVKCNEAIVTGVAASTTNYCVKCVENTANLPVIMLEGRFKVSSASVVNAVLNTTGTVITHKCVLIAATTGDSIANAGLWKDYGATVMSTAATGTAVTVGTPVVSALVV